jgi:hypothetical protein
LLLAIVAIIGLFGIAKIRRATQPAHGVPWGQLLVWAALFGGGLSIWLLMSN